MNLLNLEVHIVLRLYQVICKILLMMRRLHRKIIELLPKNENSQIILLWWKRMTLARITILNTCPLMRKNSLLTMNNQWCKVNTKWNSFKKIKKTKKNPILNK